ncbi:potassium channel family protein [Bacillus massilinigeriensis]|uniref:potassium channel family protein n=1 Tax=Bacillus massilionigeriensis TaxID=1805475 RepID=UPI00096AF176|nr:potassium channel family protein [Bacillus massilionigeriensis]
MVIYGLMVLISFCMIMSLRMLFFTHKVQGKWVSFENFLFLTFIYATVMIGFGLIYILLELDGSLVLMEGSKHIEELLGQPIVVKEDLVEEFFDKLETGLYFSAITLFSVGYGDIAPVGIGRIIAVIEALIGYTIPAAFVARAVFDMEK